MIQRPSRLGLCVSLFLVSTEHCTFQEVLVLLNQHADTDGSQCVYDLCFIMNPSEVIHENVEPEFYTIRMQAGDIYLLFEEWLQYPHTAIPHKDAAELKRKVLLIGGQFSPNDKPFPAHRVEGLGLFYHYKL